MAAWLLLSGDVRRGVDTSSPDRCFLSRVPRSISLLYMLLKRRQRGFFHPVISNSSSDREGHVNQPNGVAVHSFSPRPIRSYHPWCSSVGYMVYIALLRRGTFRPSYFLSLSAMVLHICVQTQVGRLEFDNTAILEVRDAAA